MSNTRYARKLAAILYADVVSYSKLTGEDEDSTHTKLIEYLDYFAGAVADRQGRVVNYAGDAVLAEFKSALDAVVCAVEIQRELAGRNEALPASRKVQFRIGINLGDVIHNRNEIFGNGVNVAARLESLAAPGGICISDAVRTSIGSKLKLTFEFLGEQGVKNIEDPVRAYRAIAAPDSELPADVRPATPVDVDRVKKVGKPTIAVLPFDGFGIAPGEDYFIDGFTEDLITELARFRSFSVIARTSSFAFKGKKVTIREIGRELNAQFVMEGSIRHLGSRLRITAQLIEAGSETHLWADRYDAGKDELFEVQDELISQIVGALGVQVGKEELRRLSGLAPSNLDAYELCLKGNKLMQSWSATSDTEATPLFEKAIELDPAFARPYASLAGIYSSRSLLLPGNPSTRQDGDLALRYARKAIELDPLDGKNFVHIGWIYLLERNFANAEEAFVKANKLNPNDADIVITRALAAALLGLPERGLEHAHRARQLNPICPDYYLGYEACVEFMAGQYGRCVENFERMAAIYPVDFLAWYASACSHLGQPGKAEAMAKKFIEFMTAEWAGAQDATPLDYINWFAQETPIKSDDDFQRLIEGMAAAGLPRPDWSWSASA